MSSYSRFETRNFGVKNTVFDKNNSFITGRNLSINPIKTISYIVPKDTPSGTNISLIQNPNKMLILGINVKGATGTERIGVFSSDLITSAGGYDNSVGGNVFNPGIFSDQFYINYLDSSGGGAALSNNVTVEVVIQFI
jgi:hypothetical protein